MNVTDEMLVTMVRKIDPKHAARVEWQRYRRHKNGQPNQPDPNGPLVVLRISGSAGEQHYALAGKVARGVPATKACIAHQMFVSLAHDAAKCSCKPGRGGCPAGREAMRGLGAV